MNKNFILLVILSLCYKTITSDDINCSDFEALKQRTCSELSDATNLCHFFENKCINWYSECEEYNPSNNDFNDNICKQIEPSNPLKKCSVSTESGSKKCLPIDKECKELSLDYCLNPNVKLNQNKRCVLHNDKCEEHSNTCNGLSQEICENNIPIDKSKKCIWGTNCIEENRNCKDYIEYKERDSSNNQITSQQSCHLLKSTSPKVCYLDEKNVCSEVYKDCDNRNQNECANIIPLTRQSDLLPFEKESLYKCEFNNVCKKVLKNCKDYNSIEGPQCSSLTPEKDSTKSKKICILEVEEEQSKCNEIYITCSYYNDLVATNERNENDCKLIIPRDTLNYNKEKDYKCAFDGDKKECFREKKQCNEIEDKDICISHNPKDTNKRCVFRNDKCVEEYKTCELYNENASQKNQNNCQSILPIYSDGKIYQCIYSNENNCEKKEIKKCEDYKGQNEDYCRSISIEDSSIYKCALVDNQCVTQFKYCNTYNNYGGKGKKACESIKLYENSNYPYYRCFLEWDYYCSQNRKLCSEYSGEDEDECKNYRASVDWKQCVLEDKKCVEKYIEPTITYSYCSDYRGTDKAFCESIKPHKDRYPDLTSKCIYGDEGCEKTTIKCEDARDDASLCLSITPENANKMCIFKNNACSEQYKSCLKYEENEAIIDKTICESIILPNDNTHKCIYTAGTGNAKGTCRSGVMSCSDFKVELITSECLNISPTDPTKKCSFSNNVCSPVAKTCKDFNGFYGATKEMCEAALTSSSDKKCDIDTVYGYGCYEIEKQSEPNGGEENQDSADKSNLNKIILMLFGLLF